MKKYFLLLAFVSNAAFAQDSLQISPCGGQLRNFYLNQNVQNKWLAGHHINWETGDADQPEAVSGIKTHCSAFVAAVCKRNDLYILRPPDHRQELLANAQYDWLTSSQSAGAGWQKINDNVFYEAERLADEGYVVVACTKNPDSHKPGHIAFVMPATTTAAELNANGPLLIQAGTKNSDHVKLRYGFRSHITDWNTASDVISFYYNTNKYSCN